MAKYTFSDIAHNLTEKRIPEPEDMQTYVGLEHMDSGSLTIKRFGSSVPIKGQKLVMKKGDLLFGRRNTYLKRAAIAPHDGLFSAHGMIFRPKEDVINKAFFTFFIASDYFMDKAIQISVGSLSPTVNWGSLKDVEIEIPPIGKQEELAALLWAANDAKESYQKLIELTDELVSAQFIEMFGVPGENEKGWGLTVLGECSIINPLKSEDESLKVGLEVTFVPMASVSTKGAIDTSEIKSYEEVKSGYTYFRNDDVLFAKITPCMENGKGAIAVELRNGVGFGSTEFHVLRPVPGVSNEHWLYHLTMASSFRIYAAQSMTGTGGQRRVPASYLSNFLIAKPPLELQNQFEAFVIHANQSTEELKHALRDIEIVYKKIISNILDKV